MERKGISVVGNILADNVKIVEKFPEKGMLATILEESLAVGGCVPNTAIDLKRLDKDLEVFAYGKIGNDDKGKYVLSVMNNEGLNTDGVIISDLAPTSYSDVITVKETGERTFFHHRGANAKLVPEDIDLDKITSKILHIGYLMLLDSFDKLDENDNTPMADFLKKVQEKGIKTSIDIVSESSGNFKKVAKASLPFCDYVIINEIESGEIAGIKPRDEDGNLIDDNVIQILKVLLELGVKEKVVIHCPEKGFCMNKNGDLTIVPSIKLPKGFIKGSVGAGDAFCAGSLYSIYHGYSDKEMLEFSNLVAINCLSMPDSISGVRAKERLKEVL